MKKKIGISIMTVSVILICFAGTAFLMARKSGIHQTSIGTEKIAALEWGFKFASAIPVTPHLVDRSHSQYLILEAYLDRDMPDQAAEHASRIADWRECLSYADLAVYFAQKKHDKKVSDYSKRARVCADRLIDWETSWQRDRVLLRITEAQAIVGQSWAAEKTEAQLPVESAVQARTLRLSRMDSPDDYKKKIDRLKSIENSENMEVRRDVARAYIAILMQLGPAVTDKQIVTLQTRVYKLAETLPQLMQHEILCSLSRTAFSVGQEGRGRDVLEYAEKQLKRRELKARFDVKTLVTLAEIWDEKAGDSQHAQSLLDEAKDLFMKGRLKGTDQVRALISLAQGYGIHGDHEAAWYFFRQAIQIAGLQVNARPRAMNLTEICAAIGQWSVPWPDDIEKEMIRLYEALGDPW
ncbi:MAG: hypothetical protein JW896_01590 [Deltaproteobacteria bacterium]|nr:hypothetical protein [Deltaproteobacteria bacterium]